MTPQALLPALLVPLIGYRLYRRFRSSFGRQPIQPRRMVVRIVILSALATPFLIMAATEPSLLGAVLAGLALGAGIAIVGLRLTRFEVTAAGKFYTPNAYIGATLTALLIGRLVYRFVAVAPAMQMATQGAGGNPFAAYQQNPLTSAILMVTIGYYIAYFAGILLEVRQATPPAP